MTGVQTTTAAHSPFRLIACFDLASLVVGVGRLLLRLEKTRRIVASRQAVTTALLSLPVRHRQTYIGVFLSRELNSPATLHWPMPMIRVPRAFDGLPRPEQAAVVAHEMAHVERADFVENLLSEVASLELSYHPLTWWMKRRIAESRELLCDKMAAETVTNRGIYAQALLNVAKITAGQSQTASLIGNDRYTT